MHMISLDFFYTVVKKFWCLFFSDKLKLRDFFLSFFFAQEIFFFCHLWDYYGVTAVSLWPTLYVIFFLFFSLFCIAIWFGDCNNKQF